MEADNRSSEVPKRRETAFEGCARASAEEHATIVESCGAVYSITEENVQRLIEQLRGIPRSFFFKVCIICCDVVIRAEMVWTICPEVCRLCRMKMRAVVRANTTMVDVGATRLTASGSQGTETQGRDSPRQVMTENLRVSPHVWIGEVCLPCIGSHLDGICFHHANGDGRLFQIMVNGEVWVFERRRGAYVRANNYLRHGGIDTFGKKNDGFSTRQVWKGIMYFRPELSSLHKSAQFSDSASPSSSDLSPDASVVAMSVDATGSGEQEPQKKKARSSHIISISS